MEYHRDSDEHPANETTLMKPQSSNRTPPSGSNVLVYSFVNTARKRGNNFLINNHPSQISIINNNEKHSMNELAKNNSVTMEEADKGGTIVLPNIRDYFNSCKNLLSDASNYKNVQPKTLKEFIRGAKNNQQST